MHYFEQSVPKVGIAKGRERLSQNALHVPLDAGQH